MIRKQGGGQRSKLSKLSESYKVMYNNINELILGLRELNIQLNKVIPDIIGLTETKLYDELREVKNIVQGNCNIWEKRRRNQKGGGVMLLVKKNSRVGFRIWRGIS